ncbi:hypothetical protein OUO20_13715 [Arthrobacter sp. FX8]|uniref:hypothetical protein n=1 Tax=Arthrobacter sp. FX8 TaxID=2997335 RepID=UPI00227AACC7|nr:hypothetical protein [Arthrobacter sp. FX8]WAJ32216.1 hypothetical protein OUO20_13715 [Arthrobacter sp. FX8]
MTDEDLSEFIADAPDVRTIARRASEWIGVHASRTCTGTAYVPRAGDRRYER